MPESKFDQNRHSNEEVMNFLTCGDARGPAWLAKHPADLDIANGRLRGRTAMTRASVVEIAAAEGAFSIAPGSGFPSL